MAKKAGRNASPEELEELTALLGGHPGHAYFHEIVFSLKGSQDHLELVIPKEELVDHGWQDLSGKLKQEQGRTGRLRSVMAGFRWAAAAAMLAVLVTGIGMYYKKASGQQAALAGAAGQGPLVATVGYGLTTKLVLPDGTRVWLNAGSKLTYPGTFPASRREVQLEGEAYFDVARNPGAPFSVHAGKITVGVLGTCFNVKAYTEDSDVETTLISGKVQVTLDNEPEKTILLSPHEKLTIMNESGNVKGQVVSSRPGAERNFNALRYQVQALPHDSDNHFVETAWLNNKLVINNESFETVAHMLERKYDVDIRFQDESLLQEHISGVFEKENIGQVLHILKMTTGFSYRMEGNRVFLYKRTTF